jgi:hypothetical protein
MVVTTILMVVLLVAAISTATYAWFTSSSSVTASSATMTAATSSSANIGIGNTYAIASNGNFDNMPTQVVLDVADGMGPMVPISAPVSGTTPLSAFTFNTSTVGPTGLFTGTVTEPNASPTTVGIGLSPEAAIENGGNQIFTSELFIAGKSADMVIQGAVVNFGGQNVDRLRVAIFAQDWDGIATVGDYIYVGTWASGASATRYGAIVATNDSNAMTTYTATAGGTPLTVGSIAETGGYIRIKVVAWFDGLALTNNNGAGQSATFSLLFEVA